MSMGKMSLWQIMKYREGKRQTEPSEQASETGEIDISDDEFFEGLNEEIAEGEVISPDQAFAIVESLKSKRGA